MSDLPESHSHHGGDGDDDNHEIGSKWSKLKFESQHVSVRRVSLSDDVLVLPLPEYPPGSRIIDQAHFVAAWQVEKPPAVARPIGADRLIATWGESGITHDAERPASWAVLFRSRAWCVDGSTADD